MPEHNQSKTWLLHLKLISEAIDYMQNSDYKMAANKIRDCLWIQPNHADAYFLLHLCHKDSDQKSALLLNQAVSLNPLCQIYELQSEKALKKLKFMVDKSIDYEKKIIRENGILETSIWYNYTVYLHEQTDYQRVEEIYQRLFAKYPELYTKKSHAFLGNYANVLYDNGKYELALQKYEKQIELNPEELRFFSNCAMLHTIVGNYTKAQLYIKNALRGSPEKSTFLFNYSNILSKTHRYEESIGKIKQSIQKQSSDPIFRLKLGITLLLWKQDNSTLTLATDSLKKAIHTFSESILKNNIELTNCNKRILSMKNIICVRLFAEKVLELVKYSIKWDRIKDFLEILTDYLIVGQATKLQLNQKIRTMVNQTYNQLKKTCSEDKTILVEEFDSIQLIGKLRNQTPEEKHQVSLNFFKSWSEAMHRLCNIH